MRMWLCAYPDGVIVKVLESNGVFLAGLDHELHSQLRCVASLDEAMAVSDEKVGQSSTPEQWYPLREIESGTPVRPAPDPPSSKLHRRQCPKCLEYSDSLRWKATERVPPDQPAAGWRYDGPQRVVDICQCWWCGYSELIERPQE